jgi:hypothetical protein
MDNMSEPNRRKVLTAAAAAGAFGLAASAVPGPAAPAPGAEGDNVIRPFHINVPEEALVDLRRRLAATRWPEKETVADQSQGVQLATIQQLVHYWQTGYDWRKCDGWGFAQFTDGKPDGEVCAKPTFPVTSPPKIATLSSPVMHLNH